MKTDFTHPQPAVQWDILGAGFQESALLERPGTRGGAPGSWWGGALDVEGLASHSVGLVGQAVAELSAGRCELRSGPSQLAAGFESFRHLKIAGRTVQAFAPLSGFFPTARGWIRTHANYPHHERSLLDAMNASGPEQLATALAQSDAFEAQERIVAAGGIAAASNGSTNRKRSRQRQAPGRSSSCPQCPRPACGGSIRSPGCPWKD